MTLCALFAALLAVCAWISVPLGDMAFTMQTCAVFLALGLLGGKWGSASILIYLCLGAAGLPVFSGFRGGFGILLGATGGYLWGFLFTGLCWWAVEKFSRPLAMVLGMFACYLCGSLWFWYYAGGGFGLILLRCVVPYVIPDALKLWLAWYLTKRLRQFL